MRISDWSSDVCSSDLTAETDGTTTSCRSPRRRAIPARMDVDPPRSESSAGPRCTRKPASSVGRGLKLWDSWKRRPMRIRRRRTLMLLDTFRNHGTCCPNPPGRRRKTPGLSAVAASVEATFACATGLQFQASWPRSAALLLHQADLRQLTGHGREALAQKGLVFPRCHVDRLHEIGR